MFVVNGRFLGHKPTGIHRYAFEMCSKLQELGADFYVVTPPDIDIETTAFRTIKCGSLKGHAWEQISLPRYLKKNGNPLLVSFSGCGPLNYSNHIMTIHDVSHERHPEWFSKNYWRFYGYMMPRIGKKAHAVITVSEFSKREITDVLNIPSEKLHVINCSIPAYHHDDAVSLDSESEVTERYIISVSSFDPRKNFLRLAEAFNKLEDKSLKLYIVGMQFKAFNTPDLQKLVSENIILPGYVDDDELRALYKNALFSIYPSLYEGFGIPPLESMANGCPVVASNIDAISEVCSDAVLYIDPYNVNDIANKMKKLADDTPLRDALRQKGYDQIKKYSWQKSAIKALELIKQYE